MPEQLPIQFEFWGNQTFSDFFPTGNQDTLAHLRETAKGKGEPLIFLWGDAGHGKTHLLHACCEEAFNANVSVFYFDLANELAQRFSTTWKTWTWSVWTTSRHYAEK